MLDYLPRCDQRLKACLIAHQLLRCLGLLLIVQVDSSLRDECYCSWREGLQMIGFSVVNCVKKKNLHCMAFRKVHCNHIQFDDNDDNDEYKTISALFHIPQDTREVAETHKYDESERRVIIDRDLFDELPSNCD